MTDKHRDEQEEVVDFNNVIEEDNPLDFGIIRVKSDENENPFYIHLAKENATISFNEYGKIQLPSQAKRVLVMYPKNMEQIPDEIYNKNISKQLLSKICQSFNLIPCSHKILEVSTHTSVAMYLTKDILNMLRPNFNVADFELVVPIFDIDQRHIHEYVNMYGTISHDFAKLTRMIDTKKYFDSKIPIQYNDIVSILGDYFWFYPTSEFNMTSMFDKRSVALARNTKTYTTPEDTFNDTEEHVVITQPIQPVQPVQPVQPIQKDYGSISDSRYRTTIADAIKKSRERKFYMKHDGLPVLDITKEQVDNMFMSINDMKTMYNFFNAFATSRTHCHLVTHNVNILKLMKPLFERCEDNFRYVLGYPMLTYYIEESMLRQRITRSSRCVFDINTACKLPPYQFSSDMHGSPYNVIPVKSQSLQRNVFGLKPSGLYEYSIDTLDGFRKKFNIFTTDNINKDLFDGIDWKRIAISGSIMTACIPRLSPLILISNKQLQPTATYEERMRNFFKMYYNSSDIDVVCATTDINIFIDDVFNVMNQVAHNIGTTLDDNKVIITPISMSRIFIHESLLGRFIRDISTICSKEYNTDELKNIIKEFGAGAKIAETRKSNPLCAKIIEYFYGLYTSCKEEKYRGITSRNIIHGMYLKNVPIEHFSVQVINKPRMICYKPSEMLHSEIMTIENPISHYKNTGIVFSVEDTFRYKMSNADGQQLLHRSFEIFRAISDDPFSTIHSFHLPCVRAFYDGTNVYMTTSCVCTFMTYMNIDYKYFASSQQPIDIVIKYMKRGYGTYLNSSELNQLVRTLRDAHHAIYTGTYLEMNQSIINPKIQVDLTMYDIKPYHSTGSTINYDGNVSKYDPYFSEKMWHTYSKNINN